MTERQMVLGNPPYPVPVNAVQVWTGYRNPGLTSAEFLRHLGETFIPAAALMQPPIGLRAYLPGVFSAEDLPAGVPEETALLFWDSQSACSTSQSTLAERVYALAHSEVYDMSASGASFPVALISPLVVGQPYYLLDQPVDWMTGQAFQLLIDLPGGATAELLSNLASWAQGVAGSPPAGLGGAYLLAGSSYLAWWELWEDGAEPLPTLRDALSTYGRTVADGPSVPATVTAPLDMIWQGVTVQAGDLYNLQFNRPTVSSTFPED
jgi:hypothetical protein